VVLALLVVGAATGVLSAVVSGGATVSVGCGAGVSVTMITVGVGVAAGFVGACVGTAVGVRVTMGGITTAVVL
jgi:hypothetical protein